MERWLSPPAFAEFGCLEEDVFLERISGLPHSSVHGDVGDIEIATRLQE